MGVAQPYLHKSRHDHANKRVRGPHGRFLTAAELAAMRGDSQTQNSDRPQHGVSQHSAQELPAPDGDADGSTLPETNTAREGTDATLEGASAAASSPQQQSQPQHDRVQIASRPAVVSNVHIATNENASTTASAIDRSCLDVEHLRQRHDPVAA